MAKLILPLISLCNSYSISAQAARGYKNHTGGAYSILYDGIADSQPVHLMYQGSAVKFEFPANPGDVVEYRTPNGGLLCSKSTVNNSDHSTILFYKTNCFVYVESGFEFGVYSIISFGRRGGPLLPLWKTTYTVMYRLCDDLSLLCQNGAICPRRRNDQLTYCVVQPHGEQRCAALIGWQFDMRYTSNTAVFCAESEEFTSITAAHSQSKQIISVNLKPGHCDLYRITIMDEGFRFLTLGAVYWRPDRNVFTVGCTGIYNETEKIRVTEYSQTLPTGSVVKKNITCSDGSATIELDQTYRDLYYLSMLHVLYEHDQRKSQVYVFLVNFPEPKATISLQNDQVTCHLVSPSFTVQHLFKARLHLTVNRVVMAETNYAYSSTVNASIAHFSQNDVLYVNCRVQVRFRMCSPFYETIREVQVQETYDLGQGSATATFASRTKIATTKERIRVRNTTVSSSVSSEDVDVVWTITVAIAIVCFLTSCVLLVAFLVWNYRRKKFLKLMILKKSKTKRPFETGQHVSKYKRVAATKKNVAKKASSYNAGTFSPSPEGTATPSPTRVSSPKSANTFSL